MLENNKNNNIICGEKVQFDEYTRGLGEFYFENGDKYSENIFQIDAQTEQKETYASIKKRSVNLAINLKKLGVTSKDTIITCSKNSLDHCVPHMSALFLGAKTAALHHAQSIRDWTHCINLTAPTYIFLDENCVESMEKCIENLKLKPELIVFGKSKKYKTFGELEKTTGDDSTFRPFEVKNCRETAVILFSSGTTGPPKGMCISHYSLINKAVTSGGQSPFSQSSTGLVYSTLYWISSVIQLALCYQTGGIKIIPPPDYNPKDMLEMIEKYKIDFIFLNPILLRPLFNLNNTEHFDVSSLKFITTVGTTLHQKDFVKLKSIFKNTFISQAYGISESITSGTGFHPLKHKHLLHKLNSIGKVIPNCEIKIVDPQTGVLLGPNQSGEIFLKSLFCFNGYYNTDCSSFDKDGFFKTGDLGYYDEDECFYLIGRESETFKYRNFHVSPDYIESILQEHPDVVLAGVFGIPDEKDGFLPAACVILKDGAKLQDVEDFYVNNVADWHRLRGGIKVVEKLPMTPTMKVQRNKLLDIFFEK